MSVEDNKRLVANFAGYFEHSDVDSMLARMTDEVRWWVNADPELFPIAGAITKSEFERVNREMHASLQAGMKMDVVGMVAENDKVAAELRAHAVTKEGRVYDNDYHMLFTIVAGKIDEVREYTDLLTVADVFSLPPIEKSGKEKILSDGRAAPVTNPSLLHAAQLTGAKRVVSDYLGKFGKSDIQGVLEMMTDDATWWLNGKPARFPGAGTRSKADMAEVWPRMFALLDGGLRMDPDTLIVEGDCVVAQVRSHGTTKGGKVYRNGFLMLFTVRDGKVASVKEYTDLVHAAAVFG